MYFQRKVICSFLAKSEKSENFPIEFMKFAQATLDVLRQDIKTASNKYVFPNLSA